MANYFANKFKESILKVDHQIDLDFALTLEHAIIDLTETAFKATTSKDKIFHSKITKVEDEIFTVTYEGKFPSGNVFRLVQPKQEMFFLIETPFASKSVEGGFTIASKYTQGWAISFYLTPNKPAFKEEVTDAQKTDSVKRHVEVFNATINSIYPENALAITQKLLEIIRIDPNLIYRAEHVDQIIAFMKQNMKFYSSAEKDVVSQL
ncbi:MAG: hypothetical protein NT109_06005 [Flavobacteriia bacterium]|nr:hypothetical protein [Flavobacteriia bacterium]